jgi:FAD/FMN-containing dehydrogenase
MPAFEPYLDSVDLSACVNARESAAALNARLQPEGVFWPLSLDGQQPLGELFLTAKACSRSFRFGGLGDNVLGAAWRLPQGPRVDLGGRVVKNVAGFDLIRFLAGSQGQLGAPGLLVLRLRPRPEAERVLALSGSLESLRLAARSIRASSWAHAIDALDLEADAQQSRLLLALGGKAAVLPLFEAQAQAWADALGLGLQALPSLPERPAQPWARVQAPLDEVPVLAAEWLKRYGGRVSGFLGQGVLNIDSVDANEQGCLQGLHELHQRLAPLGGHAEHPSLEADPSAPQARWQRELQKGWEAIR